MRYTSVIILGLIILGSCKEPDPVACFTYKNTGLGSVGPNQEYFVEFTTCACYAHRHQWQFPDASIPEINDGKGNSNIPASFPDTGSYQTTLTVYSKNGKRTDQITEIIEVKPL